MFGGKTRNRGFKIKKNENGTDFQISKPLHH